MITFGPPRKDVLKAYLANARWLREESGITVGGVPIATDRASQAMITGVVTYLNEETSVQSIEFKTPAGFATIGRNDMINVAKAIAAHVQACFAVERLVSAQIDAGAISTTAQIDAAIEEAFS